MYIIYFKQNLGYISLFKVFERRNDVLNNQN